MGSHKIRGMPYCANPSVVAPLRRLAGQGLGRGRLLPGLVACGQKRAAEPAQPPNQRPGCQCGRPHPMTLPGSPFLSSRADGALAGRVRLADLARHYGTPLYVYSRNAMRAAAAAYQRALAGRPHLLCYAMKANSSAGGAADLCRGGLRLRHRLRRASCNACWPPAGDPAKVVFSGVGKTTDEMRAALQAGVRCFNVESEAELATLSAVATAMGRTRAGQPARQPGRRRRHAPLHLHRPEGQQVRRGARRRRWPCTGAPPACRASRGRHRLPHRVADHHCALPRCAGPPARPGRSGGSRRHPHRPSTWAAAWASPTPTRRRPPPTCWWPAAGPHRRPRPRPPRRCCWSPAGRWWAMPACC
jgi:hypothetical protein